MASIVARAEVAGIKDDTECLTKVSKISILIDKLSNLSPQTASDFFDAKNNRFIFCMKNIDDTKVIDPTTLTNNSVYPVIIKDIKVVGSQTDPKGNYIIPTGQSILTVPAGTGEIALQNLKADNLRGPIQLQGKTTVLDSAISCDPANTNPAMIVSSNGNTFRKVAVNECTNGLRVAGNFNNFYEVGITKTVPEGGTDLGNTAMALNGGNNSFTQGTILNYTYGIKVNGNKTRIVKSTLDGKQGAVIIAHDPLTDKAFQPTLVTQNNFTTPNTIVYTVPEDTKTHTLFSTEWMAFHRSETNPEYASI